MRNPPINDILGPEFKGLILYLFKRGSAAFIIIFGRRETGKTDMALLIAEILMLNNVVRHVATNTKIYHSPFPIKQIDDLENLRLWSQITPGRKLFIFDEYGKAMRRRSPMSRLNNELIDDLQTLRKFKMSTVACTIDEKYVDNASLGDDILDGVFFKTEYKNPKVAVYKDLLEGFSREIDDIPRTFIKFDEWDSAPFKRRAKKQKPGFKDADMSLLWDWSHGLIVNPPAAIRKQLQRARKKFIKEVLERDSDK